MAKASSAVALVTGSKTLSTELPKISTSYLSTVLHTWGDVFHLDAFYLVSNQTAWSTHLEPATAAHSSEVFGKTTKLRTDL